MDLGIKADYYAGLRDRRRSTAEFGRRATRARAVGLRLIPNPEQQPLLQHRAGRRSARRRRDKDHDRDAHRIRTPAQTTTTITETTKFDRDFLVSAQVGWVLDHRSPSASACSTPPAASARDYKLNDRHRASPAKRSTSARGATTNPHLRLLGEYIVRNEKPQHAAAVRHQRRRQPAQRHGRSVFGGGIRWRDEDLEVSAGQHSGRT